MESKACLWLGTKRWVWETFKIYIFKMDFSLTSTFELSFNRALLQTSISRNPFFRLVILHFAKCPGWWSSRVAGSHGQWPAGCAGPSSELEFEVQMLQLVRGGWQPSGRWPSAPSFLQQQSTTLLGAPAPSCHNLSQDNSELPLWSLVWEYWLPKCLALREVRGRKGKTDTSRQDLEMSCMKAL